MASPDLPLIDRGIRSLYRSATKAFDKSVQRSAKSRAGSRRPPIILETGLGLRPETPAAVLQQPATGYTYAPEPAIQLLEDRATRVPLEEQPVYNLNPDPYAAAGAVMPNPLQAAIDQAGAAPSAVVAADPKAERALTVSNIISDLGGNAFKNAPGRVFPPGHAFAGQPMPEVLWRQENPSSPSVAGRVADVVTGQMPDLSQVPYELTLEGRPYDADAIQKVVDAAPGGQPAAAPRSPDEIKQEIEDAKLKAYEPYGPDQPAWAREPKPGVLPPDTTDAPGGPIVPGVNTVEEPVADTTEEPPPLDATGLPGTTTETATGALTLDEYMRKMKEIYPDLDFSNPKQAEADANARRDLDRTAMLAQLQMAAGMVKGAGPAWAGMGEGFEGAGGAYDKGFQKYQQALQDSADRYQKQIETQVTYDTARRKAALELWTTQETQTREDRRLLFKEQNTRDWEKWKLKEEQKVEGAKLTDQNIRDYFAKELDGLKLPSDTSTMGPDELAELQRKRSAVLTAMQRSLILGKIVHSDDADVDVADKD